MPHSIMQSYGEWSGFVVVGGGGELIVECKGGGGRGRGQDWQRFLY